MELAFIKVAEEVSNGDVIDGFKSCLAKIEKGLKIAKVRLVAGQRMFGDRANAERFEECLDLLFQ